MKIVNVIRKYRKEAGLTQEEMANRLGVTTHESLTPAEIGKIIGQMDKMLEEEGFDAVYEWACEKIKEYPNCNMLIWKIAVILDANRLIGGCDEPEKYDRQINSWYEIALGDENEKIRRHAADSLFGFYLRKKDYAKAEEYLQYFNDHDPMKQIYQGRLYKEHGKTDVACEAFENVLFSSYNTLNFAFSFLTISAIEENDMEKARFLAEKMGALAAMFEMGKHHECSAMLDVVCAEKNREETYGVVEQLLQNVDSLCDFQKSKLFAHMKFKDPDSSFTRGLKEKLKDGFREESYEYMRGHEGWEKLLG